MLSSAKLKSACALLYLLLVSPLCGIEHDRSKRHASLSRGVDIQCFLEVELGLPHSRSLAQATRAALGRGLVTQLAVNDAYESNAARHRK